jgi:hypothetical protein
MLLSFAHATVDPIHSVYEIWNCELVVEDYHLTWDQDYVTYSRAVSPTVITVYERDLAYYTLRAFVSLQSMLVQFPLLMTGFRWNLIDHSGEIHDSRDKPKAMEFSKLQAISPDSFAQHLPLTQQTLKLLSHHTGLFLAIADFNLANNAETDDLRLMYAWRAWEQLRGAMPGQGRKQKGEALRKLLLHVSDIDFEFLQNLTNAPLILNRHASEDPSNTRLPHPMDAQVFQLIIRNAIIDYMSHFINLQSTKST